MSGGRLLGAGGCSPGATQSDGPQGELTLRKDGRPLRTYALDSIIRWSLFPKEDIFCFWVRSDADLRQQRAVRLTGDARTVQDLLDALTSACLQLCELLGQKEGGRAGKSAARWRTGSRSTSAAPATAQTEKSTIQTATYLAITATLQWTL